MKEKNNSPEAAPATTDPSPAKMTRRRLPGRFAITLTVLHSLSPIACLAAIGAAGYAVGKNQAAGLEMIGTFIAALWTIGVEVAEVAALADRKRKRIRRFPAKFLYLVELLTAIICFAVPSVPMFVYSEVRYERCRYLKSSEQEQRPDCKSVMGSSGPGDPAPLGAIGVMYLAGWVTSPLLFSQTSRWSR